MRRAFDITFVVVFSICLMLVAGVIGYSLGEIFEVGR